MFVVRTTLLACGLSAGVCFAQGVSPATKVLGLEDMSCAAWSKTKADAELRRTYLDWARGFLSGHNYAQPARPVSVVSNGTIGVYVDRHCTEKPTSTVDVALMRMSDEYSGRNKPIAR